jgi:PAS domain S-box-containing protein
MSSAPSPSAPAVRAWPVRAYLLLLLGALVLPAIAFGGVLLAQIARSERARAEAATLAAAERTADALDRELAGLTAALQALAASPSLATGDLKAFDAQARRAAAALGESVVLILPSGQEAINTRLPPDEKPPRTSNFDPARQAFRLRRTVVSDLFIGAAARGPIVTVNVPVLRDDKTASYVLALALSPVRLATVLREQASPKGWVISVVDSRDTVIARSSEQGRYVGLLATADLRDNATGAGGTWTGTTLNGADVLAAYDRTRLADWRVAVGVPLNRVERPLRAMLLTLAAGGIVVVLLSGALAWAIARRIELPLRRLALQAARLGRGEVPSDLGALGLREADRVAAVLARSGRALQERGAALTAERARLAALVEAVPVGLIFAEAPSGRIVFGNPQVERIFGHPVLMSANPTEYREWVSYHPDGRPVEGHEYPLALALAGEARPSLKARYRRGDGTLVWMQFVAAPIRDEAGQVTGAVVATLDVDETERAVEERARFAERLEQEVHERTGQLEVALARLRAEAESRARAEEQLRQAQKMEAVGQLTGGIAHDFNNLLTIVIGSLDLLRRRLSDARQLRYVDNALEGASRAATLTQRLLAFSRQQPLAPKPLDVNKLVKGMSELLHRTLGEQVEVETVLAGGLWQTNVDPNQLENALLNLAVNARDAMEAMPSLRRLTIETGNAYLDDAYAAVHPELVPGQYVMIAVSDTGPGMDPGVIGRVFEPFFTTKPVGKGTGLGLSQVHGFVKQSGGHIAIYSETRSGAGLASAVPGTTVKLYLPRHRLEAEPSRPPVAAQPPAEGQPGGLVLFVEDQEGVRNFGIEALRDLGYAVLDAADGPTALRLLDANPEIALLLTDVVLPGMDGRRLADEARRRRPGLRVLFTTGYTRNAIVHNGQLDPDVDLVTKPFTIAALAAKLREVFARPTPGADATKS